ncbi:MAG TPA: NAD(P)-dependent oxidoreductase [Flavobacteriales bacterium]
MKKILFIDTVHEVLKERLLLAGYVCEERFTASRAEILASAHEYFGVVVRSRITLDAEALDAFGQLKFIARSGSGLENIDVEYAKAKGVQVFNSPEGNSTAVAEQAVGMLLMLLNNLHKADREVRDGLWQREENRGLELEQLTVGIIGYGVMGSAFAKRLSGFGCKVIAHDKYKENFGNELVREVSLKELQQQADVVSLHLPQTEETIHYANAFFFQGFAKNIFLINTARGKNVDTEALVAAMKVGKVAGACLDVLEYEKASLEGLETDELPEPMQYLIQSPRTVLTPHIAGWTVESYYKLSSVLADKILAHFGNA